MTSIKLRSNIATSTAALMFTIPLPALAATPTVDQYGNPAAVAIGPVAGTAVTPVATTSPIATTGPVATGGVSAGGGTAVQGATAQPQTLAAGAASPDTVGALPFTGAELLVLLSAGIALLGAGAVLRRVSFGTRTARNRSPQ